MTIQLSSRWFWDVLMAIWCHCNVWQKIEYFTPLCLSWWSYIYIYPLHPYYVKYSTYIKHINPLNAMGILLPLFLLLFVCICLVEQWYSITDQVIRLKLWSISSLFRALLLLWTVVFLACLNTSSRIFLIEYNWMCFYQKPISQHVVMPNYTCGMKTFTMREWGNCGCCNIHLLQWNWGSISVLDRRNFQRM